MVRQFKVNPVLYVIFISQNINKIAWKTMKIYKKDNSLEIAPKTGDK